MRRLPTLLALLGLVSTPAFSLCGDFTSCAQQIWGTGQCRTNRQGFTTSPSVRTADDFYKYILATSDPGLKPLYDAVYAGCGLEFDANGKPVKVMVTFQTPYYITDPNGYPVKKYATSTTEVVQSCGQAPAMSCL